MTSKNTICNKKFKKKMLLGDRLWVKWIPECGNLIDVITYLYKYKPQ